MPGGDDHVLRLTGPLDHGALFPTLGLAVHHGGAGTFAAALRAGVPSVIVPAGVDSNYWQRCCVRLGVGPRAPRLRTATPEAVARTIERCLGDAPMRERAAAIAERLAAERGAEKAADHIERLLSSKAVTMQAPRASAPPRR